MKQTAATIEYIERDVKAMERAEPQTAFLLKRLKRHHAPTYRKSLLTAYYSLQLARALGFTREEQTVLFRTALLQDIGKLHISRDILDSRNRLYQGAVWQMQAHPKYSADILQTFIASGEVDGEAVLQHHENLDGTGYPSALNWKSITLNARILRIAGSYTELTDAQGAGRLGPREAMEELYCWSDVLYDADLVELMNHLIRQTTTEDAVKGDGAHELAARNRKS